MRSRSWYGVMLAATIAVGCGPGKRTMLVVAIDSNLTVPGQLAVLELRVAREGDAEPHEERFVLGTGQHELPIQVGLVPENLDSDERLVISALGFAPGAIEPIVREDALVAFVRNEARVLDLFLASECVTNSCGAMSCTKGGRCVTRAREPSTLGPFNPDQRSLAPDAARPETDAASEPSDAAGSPADSTLSMIDASAGGVDTPPIDARSGAGGAGGGVDASGGGGSGGSIATGGNDGSAGIGGAAGVGGAGGNRDAAAPGGSDGGVDVGADAPGAGGSGGASGAGGSSGAGGTVTEGTWMHEGCNPSMLMYPNIDKNMGRFPPGSCPPPESLRASCPGNSKIKVQTATASSFETGYVHPPGYAIDEYLMTRWSSNSGAVAWIRLDLGAEMTFKRLYLLWEKAHATDYDIVVSNDDQTWTPLKQVRGGDGYQDIVDLEGRARYVRVNGVTRGSVGGAFFGYSLFDITVCADR